MYRFVALLIVLSLSQFASAASVSFGASLDQGGGHVGGSADTVNITDEASGTVHWSGNAITITGGTILGHIVILEGTITRSNDPNLEGQAVNIECLPGNGSVMFHIPDLGLDYVGSGHVTVRGL